MSVDTINGVGMVAMYCTVTGVAFGPVFNCDTDVEEFLAYLDRHGLGDPRSLTQAQLVQAKDDWVRQQESWEPSDVEMFGAGAR